MQNHDVYAALIRGINVGGANRVAMSDLRALLESQGCTEVRTLLNSGNVVFRAAQAGTQGSAKGSAKVSANNAAQLASRIEAGMSRKLGVTARVVVLSATELALIAKENSLAKIADDPSRLQVAITMLPPDLKRLDELRARSWGDEKLAVGTRAAYLWCPQGVIKSTLYKAVDRALGDLVTARNWATVQKIQALLEG